jgi:hypothetical protein
MSDAIVRNRSTKEIRTLSLEKDELKKLLFILQDRAVSAGGLEFNKTLLKILIILITYEVTYKSVAFCTLH